MSASIPSPKSLSRKKSWSAFCPPLPGAVRIEPSTVADLCGDGRWRSSRRSPSSGTALSARLEGAPAGSHRELGLLRRARRPDLLHRPRHGPTSLPADVFGFTFAGLVSAYVFIQSIGVAAENVLAGTPPRGFGP